MLTRNKRGGFKSFVRRRDGKPPVPQTSHHELSKVGLVNLVPLKRVLLGEHRELVSSFSWRTSPQGKDYWNSRDLGRVHLSAEDYQWLQELYDYHVQKQQD